MPGVFFGKGRNCENHAVGWEYPYSLSQVRVGMEVKASMRRNFLHMRTVLSGKFFALQLSL